MVTKLQAAKLATGGGSDVVIADGHEPDVLYRLATGEHVGHACCRRASEPRREPQALDAFRLATKGAIVVDDGAGARAAGRSDAACCRRASREVQGPFKRGDTVNICRTEDSRSPAASRTTTTAS